MWVGGFGNPCSPTEIPLYDEKLKCCQNKNVRLYTSPISISCKKIEEMGVEFIKLVHEL